MARDARQEVNSLGLRTIGSHILDFAETNREFTPQQLRDALRRKVAAAEGGILKAFYRLRKRGIVVAEYKPHTKIYTVVSVKDCHGRLGGNK